jgi:hypothetical protein
MPASNLTIGAPSASAAAVPLICNLPPGVVVLIPTLPLEFIVNLVALALAS